MLGCRHPWGWIMHLLCLTVSFSGFCSSERRSIVSINTSSYDVVRWGDDIARHHQLIFVSCSASVDSTTDLESGYAAVEDRFPQTFWHWVLKGNLGCLVKLNAINRSISTNILGTGYDYVCVADTCTLSSRILRNPPHTGVMRFLQAASYKYISRVRLLIYKHRVWKYDVLCVWP